MSCVMLLLVILVSCFGFFIYHRKKKIIKKDDNNDIDRLLKEFEPEPIVPPKNVKDEIVAEKIPVVNGKVAFKTIIDVSF